jgi:uncharacterized membrane protein YdfJ with MMPL/SSD domain
MAGVLYRLGRLCANHAIVVVVVWLGLVVLVQLAVWNIGAVTSNDLSLPGTESQQATDLLASRFPPRQNGSSPVVFHVAKGKITDAANKQAVESSYKALSKAPHVASAPDPFANAASGLVSKDAKTAFTPSCSTSPTATSPRNSPTTSWPPPPPPRRRASTSPSGATSAASCPSRPPRAARSSACSPPC